MNVYLLECLYLEFNSCLEFLVCNKDMFNFIILFMFVSSLFTMSLIFYLCLLKPRLKDWFPTRVVCDLTFVQVCDLAELGGLTVCNI